MKPYSLLSICSIIFLGSFSDLSGQVVPGYQGKRFFAEANLNFMPALMGPTKDGKSVEDRDWLATNTRYQLGIGYVLRRRLSLRLTYDQMITAYEENINILGSRERVLTEIKGSTFGIGVDFSSSWTLSPIGPSIGLTFNFGNTERSVTDFLTFNVQEPEASILKDALKYERDNYYVLDLRYVNRHILKGNLYIMYGGNIGYAFGMGDFESLRSNTGYVSPYNSRMLRHYILNLQIGAGYVLF